MKNQSSNDKIQKKVSDKEETINSASETIPEYETLADAPLDPEFIAIYRYGLDLDYLVPTLGDISHDELNEIILVADAIIRDGEKKGEKSYELAEAYYKKAQCLLKLEETPEVLGDDFSRFLEGLVKQEEWEELPESDKTKKKEDAKSKNTLIKNLLDNALEIIPGMPQALMQMGKYYAVLRGEGYENLDKAIDMYTQAIMSKPDFAAAFHNRAVVFCNKPIKNDKGEWETYNWSSGISTEKMKDYCLGRISAADIKENYSSDGDGFSFIEDEKKKFQEYWNCAVGDFTEAIRICPFEAVNYYKRAQVYYRLEEYAKAVSDYNRAMEYASDEFKKRTNLFYKMVQSSLLARDYENAVVACTEAMRFTDFNLLVERALAYLMLGKETEAITDMDESYRRHECTETPKEIVLAESRTCAFCGLPNKYTNLTEIVNDTRICCACKKKNGISVYDRRANYLKKNPLAYREYYRVKEYIGELRTRANEFAKPKLPQAVLVNSVALHENLSVQSLKGETFKTHEGKNVEVSNMGRVRSGGKILEQYDPKNDGYLFVDINGTPEKVYRLVAETWIAKPDQGEGSIPYNTVHHISNNGYDNRVENLMWVTAWQHAMIHPWLPLDSMDHEELCRLLESYHNNNMNITSDDFPRMLGIAQKAYQTGNPPGNGKAYRAYWEKIINDLKNLLTQNETGVFSSISKAELEAKLIEYKEKKKKGEIKDENEDFFRLVDESFEKTVEKMRTEKGSNE